MPRSILIDPREVRKRGVIKIKDIPLNRYKPDIEAEIKKYGKKALLRILDRKSVV